MTDENENRRTESDAQSGEGGDSLSQQSQERTDVLGGSTQKGYTDEGDDGSEGGYGFIRPSAESNDSSESE